MLAITLERRALLVLRHRRGRFVLQEIGLKFVPPIEA